MNLLHSTRFRDPGRFSAVWPGLLIFLVLFFMTTAPGQPFIQHTISEFLDGPSKIKVADMDGDGDKDVVVAAYRAHKIVWYEAPDWQEHTIVQFWLYSDNVDVADMDGDGDMDVLSASFETDVIAWFENPLWIYHPIDTGLDGAAALCAADMNGDDTLDVVASGVLANQIVWYKGPGWEKHTIDDTVLLSPAALEGPYFVYVQDMDNDQDPDVICTTCDFNNWSKGTILLYEAPDWTKRILDSTASWTAAMAFADLDGDGDRDALATGFTTDKIFMYEAPNWSRHIIDTYLNAAIGVDAGDIDKDGIIDIVASGQVYSDPLRWYKGPDWEMNVVQASTDNINTVFLTDLDGDDDLDIVATYTNVNKVFWFENEITDHLRDDREPGTADHFALFQNHPNPFNPVTRIEYRVGSVHHSPVLVELEICDLLGQKVATLVSEKQHAGFYQVEWNAAGLAGGIYVYRLKTDQGFVATRKLMLMK